MNNQRYRNENATPLDRIPRGMMSFSRAADNLPEEAEALFSKSVPLAMAYVPDQKWGEVYDVEAGFPKGTIFPSLDFPLVGCGKGRIPG